MNKDCGEILMKEFQKSLFDATILRGIDVKYLNTKEKYFTS
jgi:hypothetical protein